MAAEMHGGYLMRHHLLELGHSDKTIRMLVRSGRLTKIRHGTYAATAVWSRLDEVERHCITARSLLDKLGDAVAATHQTACALLGLDLYGADLSSVHLTRLDGLRGRAEAGVVFHAGAVMRDLDLHRLDDRLVTVPMRAVVEAASIASTETGMVVASSALRAGTFSQAELDEHAQRYRHWRGTRLARLAIRLSDARLESVGEVRSLFLMWQHGISHPELQMRIVDHHGLIVARTDFAWIEARHTGEFDGLFKYGRLNPHHQDPGRQIADEKIREDKVREAWWGMSRWVWADLNADRRSKTARRIAEGIDRSRRLHTGRRTIIPLG